MPAALATRCRVRKNRRAVRRRTSGRTVYAYVGGNPISFVDPLGLEECYYTEAGAKEAIQPVHPELLLLGAGRLFYAGLSSMIPTFAAASGELPLAQAAFSVAARNSLKDLFRGPLAPAFSGVRQPSFQQAAAKYGYDAQKIIGAASRTNTTLNAGGAAAAAAGAASLNSQPPKCGCPK